MSEEIEGPGEQQRPEKQSGEASVQVAAAEHNHGDDWHGSAGADRDIDFDEYEESKKKAEMYNTIGWSISGVAIAGAVFGFWSLSSDDGKVSLAPTGTGASLMVRF